VIAGLPQSSFNGPFLFRPVRRIPRSTGIGLEDPFGALRRQQVLGGGQLVGQPVQIHDADRILICQDGRIAAEHRRSFGRKAPGLRARTGT
jgi:hypothetical protein